MLCDVRVYVVLTRRQIDAVANPYKSIELDVDIGADARDWSSIQVQEKLKPVETDLRRIEEMVAEIVSEMEYLRAREQKLRDTNESTNERVKWFAFGTMGMLVGLGAWQVVYLRAYFRYVLFYRSFRWVWYLGNVANSFGFVDPSTLSRPCRFKTRIMRKRRFQVDAFSLVMTKYGLFLFNAFHYRLDPM